MNGFSSLKMYLKLAVIISMIPALLGFILQGGQSMAMGAEKADVDDSLDKAVFVAPLANSADGQNELAAEKSVRENDIQPAVDRSAPKENVADVDDDMGMIYAGKAAAGRSADMAVASAASSASSATMPLPTPPPDGSAPAVGKNTLLLAAVNTPTKAPEKSTPKPATGPKTSKSSSISTPVLVAAGVALAVGAAVAVGGGSGSDSSSDSGTTSVSTTPASSGTDVIKLSDLVRIGDDSDYNAHHSDKFKVSRPSGTSWTDTFSIDNFSTVKSAKFSYTVAASKVGNPIYINGRQAGRLCNPGNTAWNVESCSTNITGYIRAGSNEIKIKCATDPSDTVTPLDDVELYNLRIQLTR